MNFNRIVARVSEVLGTVHSASHVAAALKSRHRPDPVHLRRLGIDPSTFMKVGRG